MHKSIDDFLWPNKYLLSFLGFWPMNPNVANDIRFFNFFRIILSIFIVCTLFIPQILTVMIDYKDLSVVTGIGSMALEVGQLFFKLLYMLSRQKNFRHIYERIKQFWEITNNKKERESIEKLAELAKHITIIFFVSGISNVFTYVSASLVIWLKSKHQKHQSVDPHLPLDIRYGIDVQHSPNFEIALCCQATSFTICAIGLMGFDATMMTFILHICGQFRLISERFRAMGCLQDEVTFRSQFHRNIGAYANHHRQAIRIAKEIRVLLSPVIFVQLMSSGIEIGLCIYVLVLGNGSNEDLAKYAIYTITMFLQLLVWCWPGELLIRDSGAVADVMFYEVPWYLLPVKQQRVVHFMILRAQSECCVTALSFQVMSMSKLTEVFNSAASFFALLRSVFSK